MRLPKYLAPGFRTGTFDQITVSIRDFADMLKTPDGCAALTPNPASRVGAIVAPRFVKAHAHLRTDPVIPQNVRDEAAKYSRELVWSLDTFKSKIVRGQSHGALDSSRLARLASPGISAREFDRLAMSAYRRREHVQSVTVRPRIAFVADMNNKIRVANPTYTRTLGRLAYIVGEAAKLSGVEVCMIGSRGYQSSYSVDPGARAIASAVGCPPGDRDTRPHIATVLKGWNDDVTGPEYALFTDATTFAFSTIVWGTLKLVGWHGGDGINSDCGAGGIEFARSQGANLVIAFGQFDASERADLTLDPSSNVETVVRAIVAALAHGKAA